MTTASVTQNFQGSRSLPKWLAPALLMVAFVASFFVNSVLAGANTESTEVNLFGVALVAILIYSVGFYFVSRIIEGKRKSADRLVTILVTGAFALALIPLVSLAWTVIERGAARFDVDFFTFSMRNIVGAGGGAYHAIIGTLQITGLATLISVPIGIMTAIYLVEYARGPLAKAVTFFVDVMTGIPSIVATVEPFAVTAWKVMFATSFPATS